MVDVDKLHLKTACFDGLARLVGEELDLALQMMLLKLELDKPGSEPRAVDGAVELLHGIGNAADVVLMTVGQEHAADFFLILDKVRHVRNDKVNAVHVVFGKAETAVDDDDILAVFQNGHVLADFVESTEGNDL